MCFPIRRKIIILYKYPYAYVAIVKSPFDLNITSLSKQEALLRRQIDELRTRVTEALKAQTGGTSALKSGG